MVELLGMRTPGAIFVRNLACSSSSRCDRTLSLPGSSLMPLYQTDRLYGVRTFSIRFMSSGSLVTRSLGPTRATEPERGRPTVSCSRCDHFYEEAGARRRTVFLARFIQVEMGSATSHGADEPPFGKAST